MLVHGMITGNAYTVLVPLTDRHGEEHPYKNFHKFEMVIFDVFGGFILNSTPITTARSVGGTNVASGHHRVMYDDFVQYTVTTDYSSDFSVTSDVFELCQTATILFDVDSVVLIDHCSGTIETILNREYAQAQFNN